MYIDPHILALRPELDDPTTDGEDSPSHLFLRSLKSSDPLIPTDIYAAAAEATPTELAVKTRRQPSLISSHIGIFLSAIVGLCACLIFLYWLHGCFKVGGLARPRSLNPNLISIRPGIFERLRRYLSEARAGARRRLAARRAKKVKERSGACGCYCPTHAPENPYPVCDAGAAVELREYSGTNDVRGVSVPQPVFAGPHVNEPLYHWDPMHYARSAYFPTQAPADTDFQDVDITSQRESGIFSGLTTQVRSLMRSWGRWMGGGSGPGEETYFMERTGAYPTPPEACLFADDGLRTPPPKYEESYRDGSTRAL